MCLALLLLNRLRVPQKPSSPIIGSAIGNGINLDKVVIESIFPIAGWTAVLGSCRPVMSVPLCHS